MLHEALETTARSTLDAMPMIEEAASMFNAALERFEDIADAETPMPKRRLPARRATAGSPKPSSKREPLCQSPFRWRGINFQRRTLEEPNK